jgi:hypothetical protein
MSVYSLIRSETPSLSCLAFAVKVKGQYIIGSESDTS